MLWVLSSLLCFLQHLNLTGLTAIDPYQTLGLKKEFSPKDIHRVYRRYITEKLKNPDPSPRRRRQIEEIEFAYSILGNPSAKTLYDKFGVEFLNNTDFTVQGYASDIQLALVQRAYGQIPTELVENGGTLFYPVEFSLVDFYKGAKKRIVMNSLQPCKCKSGGTRCAKCRNSPIVEQIMSYTFELPAGAPNFYVSYAEDVFDRTIPRGAHNIVFFAICQDDAQFVRVGNDLWTNQTITLSEAIRGKAVEVVNIDDETVTVEIGTKVQNGGIVRVPGMGFPFVGEQIRGDLVVNFDVSFPGKLTDAQKQEIAALLPDDESQYE